MDKWNINAALIEVRILTSMKMTGMKFFKFYLFIDEDDFADKISLDVWCRIWERYGIRT